MLSENLKQMRISKGFTQEELALELGVVRQTISKWEQGLSVPDAEMLIDIADKLETSVSELLGETISNDDAEITIAELSNKLSVLNEQLAKEKDKKRKILKVLSIIGIIVASILIILQTIYVVNILSFAPSTDVSGVIIGGADGPTAIFVASKLTNYAFILIALIILFPSVVGLVKSRKK